MKPEKLLRTLLVFSVMLVVFFVLLDRVQVANDNPEIRMFLTGIIGWVLAEMKNAISILLNGKDKEE